MQFVERFVGKVNEYVLGAAMMSGDDSFVAFGVAGGNNGFVSNSGKKVVSRVLRVGALLIRHR